MIGIGIGIGPPVMSGLASLNALAASDLGTAPLHYWDFLNNRALFNSVDVGGVTSTPGWSFTRASTGYANQVPNPEFGSTNLALQSQTFENVVYTTNTTVTANQASAPDGTNTADLITVTAADSNIRQAFTPASVAAHTFSIWLRSATGSSFDTTLRLTRVVAFSAIANTTITVTAAWQRFSLTATVLDTTSHEFWVGGSSTLSTGENCYAFGYQIEPGTTATTYKPTTTVAVTDVSGPPLVSFGSGVLRRTDKGVLIEGARTNLALQSQTLEAWSATTSSVSANALAAPDGTTTADRFIPNSGTTGNIAQQTATTANATTYTASVYFNVTTSPLDQFSVFFGDTGAFGADRSGVTVTVSGLTLADLTVGAGPAPTAKSITTIGNGWYRLQFTIASTTVSAGSAFVIRYLGASADGTKGIAFWGAQLEAASFPSSYIPTTTASATRAADVLTVSSPGVSYPLSLFAEFEQPALANSTQYVLSTAGASDIGTESASLYSDFSSKPAWIVFAGSANQGNSAAASAMTAGVAVKSALRVNTNDARFASSATLLAADTVLTLPTAPTQVRFGSASGGNMYLRRAAIFNSALNDAALTRATST